jgi:hypothetical protein
MQSSFGLTRKIDEHSHADLGVEVARLEVDPGVARPEVDREALQEADLEVTLLTLVPPDHPDPQVPAHKQTKLS